MKMPKAPSELRKPRLPASRYSIAEWFGKDISMLSPMERQSYGRLAKKQMMSRKRVIGDAPLCPFLSTLIPQAPCNKRGGVCSIRKYAHSADGCEMVADEKVVTTCPNRFIQDIDDGRSILSWISEKMIDVANPIIVKETPFLRKVSSERTPVGIQHDADIAEELEEEQEAEKKAGRIDWIVVNPATLNRTELEWAAVETQALYFSGDKMMVEFEAYAASPSPLLFPLGKRRPDYRSNGPKRLSPQLDVKVPVLGAWGKKVAVLVDRYFFNNMTKLDEVFIRGDERARRDNAAIVWFVVDYDENLKLRSDTVIYTTLSSSRKALNATEPLAKADFISNLKGVIDNAQRRNKVFRPSTAEAPE